MLAETCYTSESWHSIRACTVCFLGVVQVLNSCNDYRLFCWRFVTECV